MSFHTIQSQSIAFAAICQAAYLVDKIAEKGICPDAVAFNASLRSITRVNGDSPLEIFGGYESLKVGFSSMQDQLAANNSARNMNVTKYIIGIISLERKLSKNRSTLNMMGERINQVNRQLVDFDIDDAAVLANFDSIYKDLISTLGPKIQITGNSTYLRQTSTQQKIRSGLLAGVRAAVLWRQIGGRRRQLVFSRKAMIEQATQNLKRC